MGTNLSLLFQTGCGRFVLAGGDFRTPVRGVDRPSASFDLAGGWLPLAAQLERTGATKSFGIRGLRVLPPKLAKTGEYVVRPR